ncbi:MAG TPA: hypothetical protein PKU87_00630 [Candidatus Atribacteria bacterium]|nr:hypothetical protein [Candidatus Atribacteria bacterium]
MEQFIREREKPGFSQVDSLRRKAREAERKEDSEEEGRKERYQFFPVSQRADDLRWGIKT